MAYILDWSFVLFAQTATVLVMLMSNIFAVHHLGPPKLSKDANFYPLLQESSNTSSGSQEWGFSQNWCLSTVFGHVLKWGTPPNHFNRENDDNHCILRPKSGDGAAGQWTDHKMSTFLHAPTRTRRGQKGQLTGSQFSAKLSIQFWWENGIKWIKLHWKDMERHGKTSLLASDPI